MSSRATLRRAEAQCTPAPPQTTSTCGGSGTPRRTGPCREDFTRVTLSGGSGERTWTGLAFQVAGVVAGAREVVAAGGQLRREPEPEDGEPPHLAMCVDPEGNEFMLTRKRH